MSESITRKEIVESMFDEMPFYCPQEAKKYISEAMRIYANQKVKESKAQEMREMLEKIVDAVSNEVIEQSTPETDYTESLLITAKQLIKEVTTL